TAVYGYTTCRRQVRHRYYFFFSSRRRHTRSKRDWSSDVCSSDLGEQFGEIIVKYEEGDRERPGRGSVHHLAIRVKDDTELEYWRSEERRVGKEWRSRWWTEREKRRRGR